MLSDETLDQLQRESELIQSNRLFWQENMDRIGRAMEALSEDDPESPDKFEKLRKELRIWEKRGEMEEASEKKNLLKFKNLLLNNLCSGIMSMELGNSSL